MATPGVRGRGVTEIMTSQERPQKKGAGGQRSIPGVSVAGSGRGLERGRGREVIDSWRGAGPGLGID